LNRPAISEKQRSGHSSDHRPRPLTVVSQPLSAPAVSGQVKGRYAFITSGLSQNLVDSETMLGSLSREGYELVSEPAGSDFVVINTCGFIREFAC
jgi:ribosomal protein S12 methylthiotransferase